MTEERRPCFHEDQGGLQCSCCTWYVKKARELAENPPPVAMLLWCPQCGERHYDVGEFAERPHHTHACQECGMTWRPAVVPTVGVYFLPGFQNKGGESDGR
jgi:hypothetical protein